MARGQNARPGRKGFISHEPTETLRGVVSRALCASLTQDQVSQIVGIDADTLRTHYQEEIRNAKNRAVAAIAGKLIQKALNGDNACMFFYLKTQAGWREVNRTEVTGQDGGPLVAVIRESE